VEIVEIGLGVVGVVVSFLVYLLHRKKHNKEVEDANKKLKSKILDISTDIDSVLHESLHILNDRLNISHKIIEQYLSKLQTVNMDTIQKSLEKIRYEIDKINTYIESNEKFTKSLINKKIDCVEDNSFEKEYEIKKYELHNYNLLFKNYNSAYKEVLDLLKESNLPIR
jgi:gas vesicle protein